MSWRGPIPETPLGPGKYLVTAKDTLLDGEDLVLLHGEGRVRDAARGVEMSGTVNSLLEEWGMVAGRNLTVNGNVTIDGKVHAGSLADFGPGDVYLKGGSYDDGYAVTPPPIYTEPQYWGDKTTYYKVICVPVSGMTARGDIYKFDWDTSTFVLLQGSGFPENMVKGPGQAGVYEITINSQNVVFYFTTVFLKDPGDLAVVVDFGQPDASGATITDLVLPSTTAFEIPATIINTRFEGVSEYERTLPCAPGWKGGTVTFRASGTFAPDNCVALIVHNLGSAQGQQPNARGSLGTAAKPALTYVTGTVNGIKGDLQVWGALIALCDINTQGGPAVHHMPQVLDCLPFDDFDRKGSGFLRLHAWREVPL
jgi:hypothetical protein